MANLHQPEDPHKKSAATDVCAHHPRIKVGGSSWPQIAFSFPGLQVRYICDDEDHQSSVQFETRIWMILGWQEEEEHIRMKPTCSEKEHDPVNVFRCTLPKTMNWSYKAKQTAQVITVIISHTKGSKDILRSVLIKDDLHESPTDPIHFATCSLQPDIPQREEHWLNLHFLHYCQLVSVIMWIILRMCACSWSLDSPASS